MDDVQCNWKRKKRKTEKDGKDRKENNKNVRNEGRRKQFEGENVRRDEGRK